MLRNCFNKTLLASLTLVICILAAACKTYTPVQLQGTRVEVNYQHDFDSSTYYYYAPYKKGLEVEMKRPVATLGMDLYHGKPESSLGNHVVEVLRWQINQSLNIDPDFCFYNFGGIRMPSLAAGTLYVEDAYKLLPFDNMGVVLVLPGSIVLKIFETMAVNGGWPITGATYHINQQRPEKIMIRNIPLDTAATYIVGTIDFLALGGDNMEYLQDYSYEGSQVLMRDALIRFWEQKEQQGEKIIFEISGKVILDE